MTERWERWGLPTKEEIEKKALELYYREHPEAIEHRLTPDVEKELRPPEGKYYLRAQRELMSSQKGYIEQMINAYQNEIAELVRTLEEMGEKPPERALPKEELEPKIRLLENRVNTLEMKYERAVKEKEWLEKQLKTVESELAKHKAKLVSVKFMQDCPAFVANGKVYGPYVGGDIAEIPVENANALIAQGVAQPYAIPKPYEKPEAVKQAEQLWEEYRHAVIIHDTAKASVTLKKLKELRPKIIS